MRHALLIPAIAAAVAAASCSRPTESLEAEPSDAKTRYVEQVLGSWGETSACTGNTWSFSPERFTSPGEVSCQVASLSAGPDGAIRIGGLVCEGEGMRQPDRAIDVWVDGNTITVKGVDSPIDTPDWKRC